MSHIVRYFHVLFSDRSNLWRLAGAVLTGVCYTAALPPFDQQECAWIALVPLILIARHSTPRAAAAWGGLAGLCFWVPALSWLWQLVGNGGPLALVLLGQSLLAAWCAAFFALFGWASSRLWLGARTQGGWGRLALIWLGEPLLWVAAECLRGFLFSGFPWNGIGVTLAQNPTLIQIASVGGVLAVSALVVLANGAIASIVERTAEPVARALAGRTPGARPRRTFTQSLETLVPMVLILVVWVWGVRRLQHNPMRPAADDWRVVLVQPNTPSIFSITEAIVDTQRGVLADQTRLAAGVKPDLVVWPETAVNGAVPVEAAVMKLAADAAAEAGAPLLTGAVEVETLDRTGGLPRQVRYYNAAWLFATNGLPIGRYRKQHLVPFGEFIPGDTWIPLLARLAPTGISCTPGRESSVLRIGRHDGRPGELAFSVLICFEDLFGSLSRSAVRRGARALINISNDAWFEGSIEPEHHMRQAVFRAVENGVPLLRCGNTGVTCSVDPFGRVSRFDVGGAPSDGLVGFLLTRIATAEIPGTPYTRFGDLPLVTAAMLTLLLAVLIRPSKMTARLTAMGSADGSNVERMERLARNPLLRDTTPDVPVDADGNRDSGLAGRIRSGRRTGRDARNR
jgi:apolipoprotein N-acyltransferase